MMAPIHLQEVLALQAVSSVIALHALFVLPGFFAASWAIADAPTSMTATAADAPNSFALALTSLSPDSSSRKDLIARLEAKNNCGCGALGAAAKALRWIATGGHDFAGKRKVAGSNAVGFLYYSGHDAQTYGSKAINTKRYRQLNS